MNSAEPCVSSAAVSPEVVAAISAALAQKLRVGTDDLRIAAVRRRPLRRQAAPTAPAKNLSAAPDLGALDLSVEELAVVSAALSAELGRNVTDVRITSIRAL
ncbi:hypothetical protein [Dysosmobacter sp.]|uniref:hypothetical protein n=1 Tax=Dysosmobacter sp. TaxID=2591382 RepID=UPI002A87A0E8|nr:hypothetical protein [Dysosmobacter sp.]MDY3281532.1 hypothetical protein [Dysosmobacter sp.]